MKGKLKLSLRIILTVAMCLFASVCFVGLEPAIKAKSELPAFAIATLDGKDYSALLGGDVVLSVEKVAVDEYGDYIKPISGDNVNTFYGRTKDVFEYKSGNIDQIKSDLESNLPIIYIKDNKFNIVTSSADVDANSEQPFYMGNVSEISSTAAVDKFNENVKLCYIKNNRYNKVENLKNIEDNSSCKFYIIGEVSDVPYYFQDIYQDNKSKQVVEDGQFVMLNNKNIGGTYINSQRSQADAIMISLGQYVYYNDTVATAPASVKTSDTDEVKNTKKDINYAQITKLTVSLTHNGNAINGLTYRNITTTDGNIPFFDFMYMITEDGVKNIEGHYVLTTNYIKGGVEYSADFDFYLVCESTYTRTKVVGGQEYTSAPVLGWTENGEFAERLPGSSGYVEYNEGINGINKAIGSNVSTISYPTITYDYTKYQLSYELTANRTIKKYELNYQVKPNTEVEMICSVSGAAVDEKLFTLTNYYKDLKLVTVVFTEQGNYNFSFKYLYTGADSKNAPTMDRLKIENKKLSIHGVDLNYSKQDYTGAQFRKFNFATNVDAEVNLIIPNGYEQTADEKNIEKYKNQDLPLMYSVNRGNLSVSDDKNIRVGEVIISSAITGDRTEDTLQNFNFDLNATDSTNVEIDNFVQNVLDIDNYEDIDTSAENTYYDNTQFHLSNYKLEYIKTNQGSMWLSYTDKIIETTDRATVDGNGSFYFYSRNAIVEDSFVTKNASGNIIGSSAKPYNNQTSFNQVGYYLVFIKIDPKADTSGSSNTTDDFWQVYAFQYMSDTIDIEVKTTGAQDANKNNVIIGAGKYTKENVVVSWKEPETFETKIVATYYMYKNYNASRDELLKTTEHDLTKDTQVLGADVLDNQFAKYLIKLDRAGKSATYKIFTIDRQPISGVAAYAIKTRASTSAVYYEFAIRNGNPIKIENGITNSYSTLGWNKKESGARISCKYSYTPIITDTTAEAELINGSWITTNYKLGKTINNCDLEEVASRSNVGYDSVLFGQGIYVFTITDEAGNATKYMLVIDNTEAYLQVNDGTNTEILPNGAYRLYGKDISYSTGSHKAINLDFDDDDINELTGTNGLIPYILNNNLGNYTDVNGVKYYKGDSSANISAMNKLFEEFNDKKYIIVENQKVVAYNGFSQDLESSANRKPLAGPEGTIKFDRDKLDGATSMYRTLYIVGANMLYSASYNVNSPNESSSYVNIEINKDNARGMVYYSNTSFDITKLPQDGKDSSNIKRLQTGSDYTNDSGVFTTGVNGAHASKDKYFAYTWLVGEDKFTVKTVKYQYFELNLNEYNAYNPSIEGSGKYYYEANGDEITLYDGVAKDPSVVVQDGRGFFLFKTNYDYTTKAGMYVVTRYYAINPDDPGVTVDYGDDTYSLTYYFIVDRNGIHDVTNNIGNFISIGLLNGETGLSGNKFSIISTNPETFKFDKNNDGIFDLEEDYYLYFSTNRVPAILSIPTGKYFKDLGGNRYESSSAYRAGQLSISVYYEDIYNQINGEFAGAPYKIFEQNVPNNEGYYNINLLEYLNTYEEGLIQKLIVNDGEGKSWLHLQGRYIVIIEDNVESTSTLTNKKIIGFDIIEEKFPEADIKIGGTKVEDEMTKVVADKVGNGKYSVMTNQEFVRVELPLCVDNETLAQVDNEYIVVKQNFNNSGEVNYIVTEYGNNSVGKLEGEPGEKRFVYLDTLLRDKDGNIIVENFDKPLYYTVTIRYQIGKDINQASYEMYKDCYVYYTYHNGVETKNYYYTSTYTITIDRLAPTENVESLRENDILIQNNYITAEFKPDYYEESQMYFTYQYADYYNNGKNLSDIYMFRVTEKTLFNKNDVSTLYVSNVYSETDLKTLSLNLPIVNFAGFNKKENLSTISTYENIFSNSYGYYQVLELDKAGNMTQYLVYYAQELDRNNIQIKEKLSLPVKYQSTTGEHTEFVIGANNTVSTIELFNIETNGKVTNSCDYFYYVTLNDANVQINDGWQPISVVTNLATSYDGENSLSNSIIKAIRNRKGSYELKILSRTGNEYKLGISVYSEDDKIDLNIEKLIEKHNGKYYINLRGANVYYKNNMFYAKEITITEKTEGDTDATTKRYICKIENGQYNYFWDNGTPADLSDDVLITGAMLQCEDNTTYKLGIIDVFGRSLFTRFNSAGKEFYTLTFEDFGKYYINEQGHYYAYSNAIITFDGIFKLTYSDIEVKINNEIISDINKILEYVLIEDNTVTVKKVYNEETGIFGVINVILQFKEFDGTEDRTFNITIDTTTNNVNLKDYTTGDNKTLKLYNNINFANDVQILKQYKSQDVTSGIMNLSWIKENKENYSYSYHLFELKKDDRYTDGIVQEIALDNTNYVIDTQEDSFGVYWFVINVMSPDGSTLLGNKIYAFEVQAVNNNLYYVKNKDGLAINPNSTFNVVDIEKLIDLGTIFKNGSLTGSDDNLFIDKLPTTNLPLYVTNHKLDVVLTENVTATMRIAALDAYNEQTITIYEIDATTYQLYFGVLQIAKNPKLVTKENISGISIGATEFTTFANETNPRYTLNAQRTQDLTNILAKNLLLLDIFYNGDLVKTVEYKEDIEFSILGNGSYTFAIRDLAGNDHVYENGTKAVEVLILREVVVTLNDQAPIENAYYNGEVSLKVFAATKYVTGSISVTAERNGNPYQVASSNPYIFKDYGTYVVKVKATYKDAEGVNHELSKTLTFSIINVEEVRTAIDLTNLKQHKITKVTNLTGEDVTNAFMKMINNKTNAMLIKHDEIMENAEELKVSAGKLLFTVEYLVSDGIYPDRTLKVQFTLNNEKPVINCSLEVGESTKKEFNISFNPGIIFEQIGESYIYINDEIAYTINAESPNSMVELVRSYKEDGAGDYYIKLVGTSGNVWQSFKVEIKEPLNTWAIVIIVVVVAVVATVVITIIVLRRKMRIR